MGCPLCFPNSALLGIKKRYESSVMSSGIVRAFNEKENEEKLRKNKRKTTRK